MSWVEDGQLRAGRMPNCLAKVRIDRLGWEKRDGGPYRDKHGNAMIRVIYQDAQKREVGDMVPISDKASWKLAQILNASGADLKRMDENNVSIHKFKDREFAEKQLVGRELKILVQWDAASGYAAVYPQEPDAQEFEGEPAPAARDATAARQQNAATAPTSADADIEEDDIPF